MDESPENRLERLLPLAAQEPAHRPEFYRLLLESTVYVLGTRSEEGEAGVDAASEVQIVFWERPDGTPIVPFFSSLEGLHASSRAEQPYLALPATSLFETTRGTALVLNPNSPYGREFTPEEVAFLLARRLDNQRVQRREMPAGTSIVFGEPAKYPVKLVDSLTQLLAKHGNVKRSFLALIYDPSGDDERPHLVVGIEADGDITKVIGEAGAVAADIMDASESLDFMQVKEGEPGLSENFLTLIKPFYTRGSGAGLRSFFGSRSRQ
jgi:hypothetical protein